MPLEYNMALKFKLWQNQKDEKKIKITISRAKLKAEDRKHTSLPEGPSDTHK